MKELFVKYKTQILYLLFGGITTLISIAVFGFCYYQLSVNNIASNVISWIASVLFAYITNKIWVFENREYKFSTVFKEITSFVLCRVLSGALEVLIMYISVDALNLIAWQVKIISTIIVIICNYVASKIIFAMKGADFNEKEGV